MPAPSFQILTVWPPSQHLNALCLFLQRHYLDNRVELHHIEKGSMLMNYKANSPKRPLLIKSNSIVEICHGYF